MKILHLGDLHIGKRMNNLSLLEDQDYILKKILNVIDGKKIETVIIAGDVYDKGIPSEEAVKMLDDFLFSLAKRKLNVLITAGNHDSVERLSFNDRLVEQAGIFISPEYDGKVKTVTLKDKVGEINFYLLPYVKPVNIKRFYPDKNIEDYTSAINVAIEGMNIDYSKRNIMISHQFVTGAEKDGTEDEMTLGGTNNVDAWVYEKFDYTALGHIHRPQNVKNGNIRYSGSPIKFSFDEEKQKKGLTIIELKEKGNLDIEFVPLEAKRDFVTIKGSYDELLKGVDFVRKEDFIRVVLTDEDDVPNAFSNLSVVYPNLITMAYDNNRTRNSNVADGGDIDPELSPRELFSNFYELRNNQKMNEEQLDYIHNLIEEIWG